jgi:hypothetical protein
MNNKNNKKTEKRIDGIDVEGLLAKAAVSSSIVTSALDKLKVKQAEEQESKIIEYFQRIQREKAATIVDLRNARRVEAYHKRKLQIIVTAEEQFMKTGDIDAYNEFVSEQLAKLRI